MSHKRQAVSGWGQRHFSAGRGLQTFSINDQRSSQQMGGLSSGMGVGGGGMEGQYSQMPQRSSGNHIGNNTMRLFASFGLSPSDVEALAEIPEEDIRVDTLPQILMQLKNRKGHAGERRGAPMSSHAAYRGGRDSWGDMHIGRMGGPSIGQSSARPQSSAGFGYSSLPDVAPSHGYGFGQSGGGGSRDGLYSELSHDSYSGPGSMGPPTSDPMLMQRRMGSPSYENIQDFLGVVPTMLPYVCSLCDCEVHSTMEWNQHVDGVQHDEERRLLLDMYPDWDPGMSSGRGGGSLDDPNMSAGLLAPDPMSSRGPGGMSSSWGWGGDGGSGLSGQNPLRTRVVVVTFNRKPLSHKMLFAFTKPFGCLRENLILNKKAFLEMSSHEEARDMVNYYNQHPVTLYGKSINFYLSRRLLRVKKEDKSTEEQPDGPVRGQGRQVVFFSKLPKGAEMKEELLTIAGRFGTVEKHIFLSDQGFIQLGTPEDALMMVKYYSVNPLTLGGRLVHLNICTKYKTLDVNASAGDNRNQGSREANAAAAAKDSANSNRTSTVSSSTRSKDERSEGEEEKEDNLKSEEKPAADNEEQQQEEVTGVMEAEDEEEEQAMDGDANGLGPEEGQEEMTKESEEITQEEVRSDGMSMATVSRLLDELEEMNIDVPDDATHEDLFALFLENAQLVGEEIPAPADPVSIPPSRKSKEKRKHVKATAAFPEMAADASPPPHKKLCEPAALSNVQSTLTNMNSSIQTLESGPDPVAFSPPLDVSAPSTSTASMAPPFLPDDVTAATFDGSTPRRTLGSAVPVTLGIPFSPPTAAVSATLRSQILAGNDINLNEILLCGESAENRNVESGDVAITLKEGDPRLSKTINFSQFSVAFGVYREIMCEVYPARRAELDTYVAIIADLSVRYGGTLFYDYHKAFSAKAAAFLQRFNQRLNWGALDLELISKHFTGHIGGAVSHNPTMCPKDTSVFQPPPQAASSQDMAEADLKPSSTALCNNFNERVCKFPNCKYVHACSHCGDGHPKSVCPRQAASSQDMAEAELKPSSTPLCISFNEIVCKFRNCKYAHACSNCGDGHPKSVCPRQAASSQDMAELKPGSTPLCISFNEKVCKFPNCKYVHACSHCGDGHPKSVCPRRTRFGRLKPKKNKLNPKKNK